MFRNFLRLHELSCTNVPRSFPRQWRANAVWLINQDADPHFDLMAFQKDNTTPTVPVPVYLPGNTISAEEYATLKGRPVIPCDACSQLGSVGDIILADLTQYTLAVKTHAGSPIKEDISIHLYFDQSLTAFRFVMRVAGQGAWVNTISPQNSTTPRT